MPGGLGGGSFGGWGGYGNGGFIADGGYAGSASSSGGVQWAVLGPAAPLGSGGVSTSGTQMAVIGDGTPPTASSSSGGYVNVPGGSNGLTPEMEAEIRDFVASAPSGMRLVEGTPPLGAPSAPGGVQSFSLGPPGSPSSSSGGGWVPIGSGPLGAPTSSSGGNWVPIASGPLGAPTSSSGGNWVPIGSGPIGAASSSSSPGAWMAASIPNAGGGLTDQMRQEMRDLLASQRGMFAGVQLVEAGAQPGGAPGGMPGAAPGAPGMAPPLGAGAMAGGPMSLPPSGGAGSDPVAPFGEAGDILDRAAGWITDTFGSGWSNALGTMPQDMRNMMEYMAATAPGAIVARLMGGGSTAGGPGSASQTGGHDWLDDYSQWFTDNVPYGKELTDAVSPYAHSALNMIMSDEELANANPFDLATYTTMAAIPVALGIYYAVPLGASYASAAAWQVGMRLSAMAPTAVTWAISPVGQRVIGAGTGAVLTGIGAYNNGASLSEAAGLTVLDFFMNGGTYGGFKNDYGSPPLGARGPTSGREFDPLSAGGPVRNLSTGGMKITSRGIDVVEQHLSRFGPDAPNQGMVQRLRDIASGKLPPTEADLNFYAHELREFVRYRSLGWPTGQPPEPDAAYELWNNAHTATLEDYGLQEGPGVLYHPSVEH